METKTAPLIQSEVFMTTWIRTESGREPTEELLHMDQMIRLRLDQTNSGPLNCGPLAVSQTLVLDCGSGEDEDKEHISFLK